jgi:hypothetical protein
MKRLCMLATLAGVMAAPSLFASMSVTLVDSSYMTSGNTYSYGNGGEFRAVGDADLDSVVNWNAYSDSTKGTTSDAVDNGSWGYGTGLALPEKNYFQTFCIEANEEFTPGNTYSVGLSDRAMYGSQKPGGDPLSIGTAYLYSQFASGKLSGYDYTYGAGRSTTAGELQQAIWWLEDEAGGYQNQFITDAENTLHLDDIGIKADANGAYGVMALNLGAAGAVQDQLVIVVPEPATVLAGALLLLPFGASTLRILRKKIAA